ncbi:MAG: hypothetical protein HYS62_00775 [Candidatus Aenigmarchaeota archaeon]|nr:hypothetical protein [Candidatus Aenigmarchaeota archaeon]
MPKPFFPIVDWLYRTVMDHAPQYLQDRDMFSAFGLGTIGMYSVVRGLQSVAKSRTMNRIVPDFYDRWLPKLEEISVVAITGLPLLYAFVDPDGVKEIMTRHPVYTSGMSGVWIGSTAAAGQDLYNRRLQVKN